MRKCQLKGYTLIEMLAAIAVILTVTAMLCCAVGSSGKLAGKVILENQRRNCFIESCINF